MSHFLLPSTPIYGHVTPMLSVGRGLVARGHRVTVLTGRKYQPAVEAADMAFWPLPAQVDYDDGDLSGWLPDRHRSRRLAAGRSSILAMFVRPLIAQHEALQAALATLRPDAVVGELAFLGVLPLLLTKSAGERLPVVGVSATPMSLTSIDCAPFGSGLQPGDTPHTRRRNRLLNTVLQQGPLRPIQTALDAALQPYGVAPGAVTYFDAARAFDLVFQLAPAGIEYPRREMPATVRFVGPLRPQPAAEQTLPAWWGELDGSRPVVHVTQGTIDNADPERLLVPAIRGLAGDDVLVVAATGGRPVGDLLARLGGRLPSNARVAEFLPYDRLLPATRVMVTNGGFGGVQRALACGVPLVVAGTTEEKPEVAARVSWSGAGRNLRTGVPSPARVRRAVRAVLQDSRYRFAAQRLQREIAELGDPIAAIAETLEERVAPGQAVLGGSGGFEGAGCSQAESA